MEDRQIIDLLWRRREEALVALAKKFGHRLQQLSCNILRNESDAQECVNDTYLAVWNTIPPQRPEPLTPYILRICKNITVSRLRLETAWKRSRYEFVLEELWEAIGCDGPEQDLEAKQLGQAIDAFLSNISKENRIIFLRRYWFGDSIRDIAGHFALSENAVSVRLNRIRGQLKDYLRKEGYYAGSIT